MRALPFVWLIVLAFQPLFGACGSEEARTQHAIMGEVLDAQSGAGIKNATVEFTSDTLEHAETTTDDNGAFSLFVDVTEGVDFGHVTARHDSYQRTAAASVYFGSEQQSAVTIELTRKPSK